MIEVSGVVTREHYAEFSGVGYRRVNRIMGFWGRWSGLLVIILNASFLGLVFGMNSTPQTGGMSEFGFTGVLVGLCAGILATALANIIYQTGFLAKFILDDGFVLGPRTFKFSDDGVLIVLYCAVLCCTCAAQHSTAKYRLQRILSVRKSTGK